MRCLLHPGSVWRERRPFRLSGKRKEKKKAWALFGFSVSRDIKVVRESPTLSGSNSLLSTSFLGCTSKLPRSRSVLRHPVAVGHERTPPGCKWWASVKGPSLACQRLPVLKKRDCYLQRWAGVIRLDCWINTGLIFRWRELISTFFSVSEADAIT